MLHWSQRFIAKWGQQQRLPSALHSWIHCRQHKTHINHFKLEFSDWIDARWILHLPAFSGKCVSVMTCPSLLYSPNNPCFSAWKETFWEDTDCCCTYIATSFWKDLGQGVWGVAQFSAIIFARNMCLKVSLSLFWYSPPHISAQIFYSIEWVEKSTTSTF